MPYCASHTLLRMGLTIHFDLQLPASTPRADIIDRLTQLRAAAQQLAFAHVGPIVETASEPALGLNREGPDRQLAAWFCISSWLNTDHPGSIDDAAEHLPDAIGFAINVGAGSEDVAFGVAFLPPKDEQFNTLYHEPPVWRWHYACKTHYASNYGEEHFLYCHTSIVTLLDHAVRIGFDVSVHDEGNYWDTRDAGELLGHIRASSHLIARLAGALHDAIGDKHKIESPIFERRDFERLEMEQSHSPHHTGDL